MKEFFTENWYVFYGVGMSLIGYLLGFGDGKQYGRREMYHNFVKNLKPFVDEHKKEQE